MKLGLNVNEALLCAFLATCINNQQIGLKFEEETNKMLRLEHGFVWC